MSAFLGVQSKVRELGKEVEFGGADRGLEERWTHPRLPTNQRESALLHFPLASFCACWVRSGEQFDAFAGFGFKVGKSGKEAELARGRRERLHEVWTHSQLLTHERKSALVAIPLPVFALGWRARRRMIGCFVGFWSKVGESHQARKQSWREDQVVGRRLDALVAGD